MVSTCRPAQEATIADFEFTAPRCPLFFPGIRPELLDKALASGADHACLDLEDAVMPEDKERARAAAAQTLARGDVDPARVIVRVNHPSSRDGARDLDMLTRCEAAASGRLQVMVPKIGGVEDLKTVTARLGVPRVHVRLLPMIETARGLARVEEIATVPGVSALVFGGLDLSLELGAALAWEPLLYARSRLVLAARVAGVGALDMPFLDVADVEGCRVEAARARALGFTGKAAVHPTQVGPILEAFRPTAAEVAHARRVTEAFERRAQGAFLLDGALVDRPVVEAARRVLSAADTEAT